MEGQFSSTDLAMVLSKKYVVIIGDSIHRGIYKDLVLFIQRDRYLTHLELKTKGEDSFLDDELIEGGKKDGANNGIGYKEMRLFKMGDHHIRFYFVTRCYNSYVKSILMDLQEEPSPDLLIMNSCLWDLSRYGRDGMMDFKNNLVLLFNELNKHIPRDCLIIWNTTPPVSKNARGGFLPPDEVFKHSVLSANILEANLFAKCTANRFDIHILDLHFHLRSHCEWQVQDGIHWDMVAHRLITNLLLDLVCDITGIIPPSQQRPCRSHRNQCSKDDLPHAIADAASPLSRPISYDFNTPRHPMPHRQNFSSRHPTSGSSFSSNYLASPSYLDFESPWSQTSSPYFRKTPSRGLLSSPPSLFGTPNFHNGSSISNSSLMSNLVNILSPGFFGSPLNSFQQFLPSEPRGNSHYTPAFRQQPLRQIDSNAFPFLGQYPQQSDSYGVIRHNARRRSKPYTQRK